MTNEKADEILDFALTEISKFDDFVSSRKILPVLSPKIPDIEIGRVTDKLFNDGYIDKKVDDVQNVHHLTPLYYCRINFHGRVFLSRGGYKSLQADQKRNRLWTITKTWANVINATAIIIIGFIGAYISWLSLSQDDKNKQDIKAITTRLDSIVLHRDTVFVIDTTRRK